MPFEILKEDLRSRKTKKALYDAMFALLQNHNFRKLTIKDICEEALISRATFYAHFADKYDLIKYWLINLPLKEMNKGDIFEIAEQNVNRFVNENKKIIKNIMGNADQETMTILFDFILSSLNFGIEIPPGGECDPRYVVFSNFYAGGLVYYLSWHVQNKFPFEVMNTYLYDLCVNLFFGGELDV